MNKLKNYCKEENYKYFLTYADNNAIGYFKKQGFHKNLKLEQNQWKEFIKDYDGGTLMEATIDDKIDYANVSEDIKKQRKKIQDFEKQFLHCKRTFTCEEFYENLSKNNIDLDEERKKSKLNIDDKKSKISKNIFNCIPFVKESNWSYDEYLRIMSEENDKKNQTFLSQCRDIIEKMKNSPYSIHFREPVNPVEVPTYPNIIKEPMDLQTLEKELESGKYKTREEFVRNVKLIFDNAKVFNKPNTIYHKHAENLSKMIQENLDNLK